MTTNKDEDGTKLDEDFTMEILKRLGIANISNHDPGGFVQVLITRPDGTTLLGVDGRATSSSAVASPPKGNILKVTNLTTIMNSGSCYITVVRNGKLETWELPDGFCPDH